jgi:membrane protein implicated in regulation of membrane protease activity
VSVDKKIVNVYLNFSLLLISFISLYFAAQSLGRKLELWSAAVMLCSLLTLIAVLLRPLFKRRGKRSSGLPSRYERVKDPWRALDKGEDPTLEELR